MGGEHMYIYTYIHSLLKKKQVIQIHHLYHPTTKCEAKNPHVFFSPGEIHAAAVAFNRT